MRTNAVTKRCRALAVTMVAVFAPSPVAPQSTAPAPARAAASAQAAAVEALDRQVESAFQRADTALLQSALRDDFRFTHGTGLVAGKAETLANFVKPGNFLSRILTSVEAEVHGDVALTVGRIEIRTAAPREYTICYARLYQHGGAQWRLVSHRTFREQEGHTETCAPK